MDGRLCSPGRTCPKSTILTDRPRLQRNNTTGNGTQVIGSGAVVHYHLSYSCCRSFIEDLFKKTVSHNPQRASLYEFNGTPHVLTSVDNPSSDMRTTFGRLNAFGVVLCFRGQRQAGKKWQFVKGFTILQRFVVNRCVSTNTSLFTTKSVLTRYAPPRAAVYAKKNTT